MSEHCAKRFQFDVFCAHKVFVVQCVILSFSSLIWSSEAHTPLQHIYYGPHRLNPSSSSSSSSSIPSLVSSLTSSSSSSPTIDLSLFGNRLIDSKSSSTSSEPNNDRSENDLLYSQFTNSVKSIPSCNQLKYLWKEANRLAINLYGPDFAFSHPKLHANPFYLTNLLLRKHHHNHLFGGGGGGESGLLDISRMSGNEKGVFIGPSRLHPVLISPTFEIVDNNGNTGNNIGEFDSIQNRFNQISSLGQSPVPGKFSDHSIPKNDLGAVYGNVVMSPDQLHHSSSMSTSSSSSSPKSPQLVKSNFQSLFTSSTQSPSSESSPRKDAKHKPKLGFGPVIANSKEIYDSNLDEPSLRSSESSKKVDNLFNLGLWHDTPVEYSQLMNQRSN